jgi:hypothetical protein
VKINIEELMKKGMDLKVLLCKIWFHVSKDIQSRIDSGEVNQEQLMKEATDLLGSLGGGGGLEGMMKMMGGGGGIAEMMKMMVVRVSDQPKTTTLLHLFPKPSKAPKTKLNRKRK